MVGGEDGDEAGGGPQSAQTRARVHMHIEPAADPASTLLDWNSQDSVETSAARLVSRFELFGTEATEMTVTARSIVEGIGVIGHLGNRQLSVLVDLFLDSLFLQAAEEGLGDGIVPAVAFAAHTRLQVIRAAESPPRVAAVLRALIRMNHTAAGTPSAYGHQDGR